MRSLVLRSLLAWDRILLRSAPWLLLGGMLGIAISWGVIHFTNLDQDDSYLSRGLGISLFISFTVACLGAATCCLLDRNPVVRSDRWFVAACHSVLATMCTLGAISDVWRGFAVGTEHALLGAIAATFWFSALSTFASNYDPHTSKGRASTS